MIKDNGVKTYDVGLHNGQWSQYIRKKAWLWNSNRFASRDLASRSCSIFFLSVLLKNQKGFTSVFTGVALLFFVVNGVWVCEYGLKIAFFYF